MANKFLIDFCGTPGAGKSSVISRLFSDNKNFHQFHVVTTDHFETPFSKGPDNFELKAVWSILDTYSETLKVIFEDQSVEAGVFMFERGIFDRIAWTRLLKVENPDYLEIAKDLERWLTNQSLIANLDLIFLLLASYEKIEYRKRKGGHLRVINPKTIQNLNQIYSDLYFEYKDKLNIILLDDLSKDISLEHKFSVTRAYIDEFLSEK